MIGDREKNFVSAVVYSCNACKEIVGFLETIMTVLKRNFEKYEIICVDDCSSDGTVEKIRAFASGIRSTVISVVNMSYLQGLELSMTAGVDLAIGDFVFEFDSTVLDYDPELIMNVYRRSLEGYDIVSAVPDRKMNVTSSLFYNIYNRFAVQGQALCTERFRVLSRRAINRIRAMNRSIPYRKAVYANCGLKSIAIKYAQPSAIDKKVQNSSDERKSKVALDALILFTDVAYRTTIAMTLIMLLFSLFSGLYATTVFISGTPVPGWTTTMLFLSFSFTGVFLLFGFCIKYLSVLVDLVFKRQHYVIESIEKLTS